MLRLIRTPADVFADAKLYLHIYIYGFLFLYLYNICNGIFTSLGDSRTPLYFLIGSSISNILLDIFFVVWLKMGVAGVAWATSPHRRGIRARLSYAVASHQAIKKHEPYAKFSAEMLVQVTIVAIPSILQQCFVSIGNLFVQSAVNSYGSAVVAGFSACQKLNTFAVTCMTTPVQRRFPPSPTFHEPRRQSKKERNFRRLSGRDAPRYSGSAYRFPVHISSSAAPHGAVSG